MISRYHGNNGVWNGAGVNAIRDTGMVHLALGDSIIVVGVFFRLPTYSLGRFTGGNHVCDAWRQ